MKQISRIEIIIMLGLYYIDKGKNVDTFTSRYNQYFNKNISSQTALYYLTRFRNVDPSNNIALNPDNLEYKKVWDEYIKGDRISELKELYRDFKKGLYVLKADNLQDDNRDLIDMSMIGVSEVKDFPQDKPIDYKIKGLLAYSRNKEVATNAVAAAKYACELGCNTDLFTRKDGSSTYTEAHHLIPLCYQDEFEYSLDVEANVISLCPNCHRKLHYGLGIENDLKRVYSARSQRLVKCGIYISFEKLLLLYR